MKDVSLVLSNIYSVINGECFKENTKQMKEILDASSLEIQPRTEEYYENLITGINFIMEEHVKVLKAVVDQFDTLLALKNRLKEEIKSLL